jgi:hydroxymethylpyrimidine pyrophosphatase-like HAD family hydrolase
MNEVSEKNAAPKAVFLDIDGTLIFRDQGPFADDLDAIRAVRRQGHRVFLNTGRSFANIPPALKEAPWVDGIACGGGAHVVLGGKTVYHKWAPREALRAVLVHYLERKKWCVFEGETALYGVNRFDPSLFAAPPLPVTGADDFSGLYRDAVITKLTLDRGITVEDREVLDGFFQLNQFEGYFEAIIKGESKSGALGIILERAGIPRRNSVAIGDGFNDIDLIRAAGFGVAMGNACDELKEAAGAVTADWAHGGVGAALRKYVFVP